MSHATLDAKRQLPCKRTRYALCDPSKVLAWGRWRDRSCRFLVFPGFQLVEMCAGRASPLHSVCSQTRTPVPRCATRITATCKNPLP